MEVQMQHPPVNESQMPQWTRVGQLDRARYPKVFTRDEFLPVTVDMNEGEDNTAGVLDKLDDQNPAIRVEYLERSIRFLKAQHQDILSSLHLEIDKLRNENKDLHFKLVMTQKRLEDNGESAATIEEGDNSKPDNSLETYLREKTTERNIMHVSEGAKSHSEVLEQQLTELRHQVRELKNKNEYLSQLVDINQPQDTNEARRSGAVRAANETKLSATGTELNINMNQISNNQHSRPVVVHDRTGSARRHPSQEELSQIVNHLYRTNQQQERELVKVKADLKEMLHSQKPEAYLVAKAYVAKDGVAEETDILPKLQIKSGTRRLPDIAYVSRDNVSLPALKNTMGTKAVERRKRTQILQRARLQHKEVS